MRRYLLLFFSFLPGFLSYVLLFSLLNINFCRKKDRSVLELLGSVFISPITLLVAQNVRELLGSPIILHLVMTRYFLTTS